MNLFTQNLYFPQDTLYNGEYGFSGKSGGWIHTVLSWFVHPVKLAFPPDTMIVRFNFISDTINNNKEGWMIDKIRLYSIELAGGVNDILGKNNMMKISPNPFGNKTEISLDKTYGNIDLFIFNFQGKLIKMITHKNCSKINLDRTGLDNGSYILRIALDHKIVETHKIIITE